MRIRPISETPGDDPAGIVARAEAKAAQGDIAGALTELARLPRRARAPAPRHGSEKPSRRSQRLPPRGSSPTAAVGTLAKAAP